MLNNLTASITLPTWGFMLIVAGATFFGGVVGGWMTASVIAKLLTRK